MYWEIYAGDEEFAPDANEDELPGQELTRCLQRGMVNHCLAFSSSISSLIALCPSPPFSLSPFLSPFSLATSDYLTLHLH